VTNETTYGTLTAVTATGYDSQGRAVSQTDVLGNAVSTAYDRAGNVTAQWGATYPVAYAYDTRGRRIAMATTRDDTFDFASVTNSSILNPNSSLDVTRWCYDAATGLLTNKVYADGARVRYTYTEGGRLATRVWSRGVTTSYAYDALGQLTNVHYSGNTPDISFAYDRLGRMVSAITAVSSHLFEYAGLDLVGEIQDGVAITRSYDGLGRSTGFNIGDTYSTAYGYDDFGRFHSVSSSVCSVCSVVNYSRLPGTDLVASMTNSAGFWWQRTYEQNRDLITAVSNHVNPVLISAYDYANDAAGRRVSRNADSFGYNARSEVIGAVIGTNSYGYAYDAIGNRVWSAFNAVTNTYAANCLNQYTLISNHVNHVNPVRIHPTYDADGNMTYHGEWYHTWDAENRLVKSQPAGFATNGAIMVDNRYDYRHRRHSKTVRRLSGRGAGYPFDPSQPGTWDVMETRTFIYDGWNLTAEVVVDAQTGTTNVTRYLWGPDVSGTLQGAGGVGGLLAVVRNGTPYFPCYDANGNITDYVDSNGIVVAHREYDPFGRTIVATGPLVRDLHFWFSTKYLDEETGFYYYGERFYSPELHRFINRDPIGEFGGLHLYAFVLNNPINAYDPKGLKGCCGPDNTAGLDAALQQAESRFKSASLSSKVKGCFNMFINVDTAMDAWDLNFTEGGSGQGCKGMITVKGGCYHPAEVNYALYGRGARLCKVFFFLARSQAWLYKMTIKAWDNINFGDHPGGWYGTPESIFEWSPQVSGWAKYGYDGTVPPPPSRYKGCKTSSKVGTVTLDKWPW
jgi:RHS repeat-associated protein